MQVNDALFPIGGYTHSYGLETYIQQSKIKKREEVEQYIQQNLRTNFLYTELLAVKLAYEAAEKQDISTLMEIDELLTATKVAREIREASHKLGSRFIKMVLSLNIEETSKLFELYYNQQHVVHHATAYGALVGAMQIEKKYALEFFLYSAASNMITNCVKTIPLSQTVGQQILYELHPLLDKIVEECGRLSMDDLGRSTPGFDIASMQHENLYSRLYMS